MSHLNTSWGRLFYKREGLGPEVHLVFHGFGQTHQDMMLFSKLKTGKDSYIFIDMFYHGKSLWNNHATQLTSKIWKEIIQELQTKEHFNEFHLIGFSMGGKISLITFEEFPDQVKSMILIGPDGIKTGAWYGINNYPKYIAPVFKRAVFKPKRLFSVMESLKKVGFLEKSIHKFVSTQMETRSKRAQVFFVWKVFGHLQPNLAQVIRLARAKNLPILLFTGKYDQMISHKNLQRFIEKIPSLQHHDLPVGHGALVAESIDFLLSSERLNAQI